MSILKRFLPPRFTIQELQAVCVCTKSSSKDYQVVIQHLHCKVVSPPGQLRATPPGVCKRIKYFYNIQISIMGSSICPYFSLKQAASQSRPKQTNIKQIIHINIILESLVKCYVIIYMILYKCNLSQKELSLSHRPNFSNPICSNN